MRDWRRQLAVWLESLADWVDREPNAIDKVAEAIAGDTPEDFTSNGEQNW